MNSSYKKVFLIAIHTGLLTFILSFAFYKHYLAPPQEGVITYVTKDSNEFSIIEVTYFVYAAEHGDIKTVKKYLNLSIDVNLTDSNKNTALMGASLNGHTDIAKLLLKHNADPHVRNKAGFSALDFSEAQGHSETTALINQFSHRRNLSSVKK